jgi:hypothetical protein
MLSLSPSTLFQIQVVIRRTCRNHFGFGLYNSESFTGIKVIISGQSNCAMKHTAVYSNMHNHIIFSIVYSNALISGYHFAFGQLLLPSDIGWTAAAFSALASFSFLFSLFIFLLCVLLTIRCCCCCCCFDVWLQI